MMANGKKNDDVKKKCFLITPIGGKNSVEFKKLEALEKNVYEIILEEFSYELVIAHKINDPGSIGDQVFKNILSADLIIANMTGLNANVMYEVAVAHSFGIPTVMISENDTTLPFDLISERTIFYDDTIEGCGDLMNQLRKKISHLTEDGNFDNPIYRVIERTVVTSDVTGNIDKSEVSQRVLFEIQDQLSSLTRQLDILNIFEQKELNSKLFFNNKKGHIKKAPYGVYTINRDVGSIVMNQISEAILDLSNSIGRMPTYEELSSELGLSTNYLEKNVLFSKVK